MPTVYGYAHADTLIWLDLQIGKLRAAGCERVFSDVWVGTELGEGWAELMQVAEVGDTVNRAQSLRERSRAPWLGAQISPNVLHC